MKGTLITIIALGWLAQAVGQEAGFVTAANLSYDTPSSANVATEETPSIGIGVALELKGPAVVPMKSRSLLSVPGNVLKLFNPFAPTTARVEYRNTTGKLSPHGWATVVGWSSGRSAFPDPLTHEPTLPLLTLQSR